MSSPPNHPPVTAWFARLDAAWRRMPAEERTRQREEIEQHLEGLVAAKVAQGQSLEDAWKAAMAQFGDPTQIGRKMYGEWQQGRTGFRADMKAILFGVGLNWLCDVVFSELAASERYYIFPLRNAHQPAALFGYVACLIILYGATGGAILISMAIGRKYPMQAIKAALYSHLLLISVEFLWLISIEIRYSQSRSVPGSQWAEFAHVLWRVALCAIGYTTIAYLASVTKRGWYRPTLADFKITLPRRRYKIAR